MRRALVTGVVGGIGAAVARRLASEGRDVTVSDLPGADLDAAAAALGLPAVAADLGSPQEVAALVARMVDDGGAPSILVSAAGGVRGRVGGPVEDVTDEDWGAIFDANVNGVFHLMRALAPHLRAGGWGRVVTISSGAGLRPSLTGIQAYTAAKHALVGLTKQFAQEFGPHGVTVNSVAPGFILSNPATRAQWERYGPEGQARLVERIFTRRLGAPEDIAAAAAFLTGEEAGWIAGQVLSVDGGVA